MLKLTPRVSEALKDLLSERKRLEEHASFSSGPLHVLVPQQMSTNVGDLQSVLNEFEIEYSIFFAHKPTKARSFLSQALKLGIGMDVASREELCNALNTGFTGSQIECTGIKSDTYLQLALCHKCLIVVDSISELTRLSRIKNTMGLSNRTNVLVRMSRVTIPGRMLNSKPSRFGVALEDFGLVLEYFQKDVSLNLKGFHFHNDERETDIRIGQLEGLLQLIVAAYRSGLSPDSINIGGGLRRQQLEDVNEWSEFVNHLAETLVRGGEPVGWRGFAYGMRLNDKGTISGRTQVTGLFSSPDLVTSLRQTLSGGDIDGQTCAEFLRDNNFSLMLEPGHALLDQCGISLFKVVEYKTGPGGMQFLVLDGNMYNLSISMYDYVMDPLLLSQTSEYNSASDTPPFEGFLVGNLCREEDFLLKRKVSFDRCPNPGDLICFINTAAYRNDFENATPHQHPVGSKVVAYKQDEKWQFCTDEHFNAFRLTSALTAAEALVAMETV